MLFRLWFLVYALLLVLQPTSVLAEVSFHASSYSPTAEAQVYDEVRRGSDDLVAAVSAQAQDSIDIRRSSILATSEQAAVPAKVALDCRSARGPPRARGGANLWNDFQGVTRGQYSSRGEAAAAYRRVIKEQSPWPDGLTPVERVMQPGETFNMAMAPGQPSVRPGGFGSFDPIPDVRTVRQPLAVKVAWKPEVDRVVTYRVRRPLPIREGPVGPQIDLGARQVLPGGGHQLEMLVPGRSRMGYLEIVGESAIK